MRMNRRDLLLTGAAGLAATRGGRRERAREMADGLARVGIRDSFEGALQYVGNPELISRTHFARFLVDSGVCDDTHDVFSRFLVEGKPLGECPFPTFNTGADPYPDNDQPQCTNDPLPERRCKQIGGPISCRAFPITRA